MSADPKVLLTDLLQTALKSVAPDLAATPILLERPKQASHGDFATNLALQLAKLPQAQPGASSPACCCRAAVEAGRRGRGRWRRLHQLHARRRRQDRGGARGAERARTSAAGRQGHQGAGGVRLRQPHRPAPRRPRPRCAYGASPRTCSPSPATRSAASTTSTTPAARWTSWRCRPGCATSPSSASRLPFPPNAYQGDYVIDMGREMRDAHQDRFATVTAMQILAGTPGRLPIARTTGKATARGTPRRADRQRQEACSARTTLGAWLRAQRAGSAMAARTCRSSACASTSGSRSRACSTPAWSSAR